MNQGKKSEITNGKSILSEFNINVDINRKEIEILEINQNIKQSTRTQISTKPAKRDI